MATTKKNETKTVQNRQARFNYEIKDELRAGIVLEGWEVKAVKAGRATFEGSSAFVRFQSGEAWLEGLTITPLPGSGMGLLIPIVPSRSRKLLLNKAEIAKLEVAVAQKGMTVVPTSLVFERRLKVMLGVAKGKNKADKRYTVKNRDVDREIQAAMKRAA